MIDRTPVVFISYSWTSLEYQQIIIDLASKMRHDGVDVKLDVWDLNDGQDKYAYMEQCVSNPEIDKVLIISDKVYAEKADRRKGGVGDETTIISAEMYGKTTQTKFIPVVMERDENDQPYLPAYLKSRLYRDLSGKNYDSEYQELLRSIFDAPAHRKPEIGSPPDWLTQEEPEELFPVKAAAKKVQAAELGRIKNIASRDFVDKYIEALKQFYDPSPSAEKYLSSFSALLEYRNVFLDHVKALSETENFGNSLADEFEYLYNVLYNVKTFDPGTTSYNDLQLDLFRVHVWELFVCSMTFMLHFEMYHDVNKLLVHTYFLRSSGLEGSTRPTCYQSFRFRSAMLEEVIKPTLEGELKRLYTLTGHYLCKEREYLPVFTSKAMANADLFLYQVFFGLGIDDLSKFGHAWFPNCYIYADHYDSMWKKLASKHFCERIMPVFGAISFEDLKDRVSKCKIDRDYHYSGAWEAAPAILSFVKLEEIATLP